MSQVDLVAVQDLLRIRHLHGPSMQTTSTPSLEDVPKLPQLVIAVQLVALSASCHDSPTCLNTILHWDNLCKIIAAGWRRHGVEHLHLPRRLSKASSTACSSRIALARRESHSGLGSCSHPSEVEVQAVTRME